MRASPSPGRVPSLLTVGASTSASTTNLLSFLPIEKKQCMNTSFREANYAHLISPNLAKGDLSQASLKLTITRGSQTRDWICRLKWLQSKIILALFSKYTSLLSNLTGVYTYKNIASNKHFTNTIQFNKYEICNKMVTKITLIILKNYIYKISTFK